MRPTIFSYLLQMKLSSSLQHELFSLFVYNFWDVILQRRCCYKTRVNRSTFGFSITLTNNNKTVDKSNQKLFVVLNITLIDIWVLYQDNAWRKENWHPRLLRPDYGTVVSIKLDTLTLRHIQKLNLRGIPGAQDWKHV